MDELINKLIADYKADRITWHDIQDMVGGYVVGKNGTENWRANISEENEILQKIEAKIY